MRRCLDWIRRNPLGAFLWALLLAGFVYFFGYHKVFINGLQSTSEWAWSAWNPENNQEHSVVILPISIFLIWYHRDKLLAAPKQPSNAGLWLVFAGIACFLVGARALQPRLAIFALPLLILGGIWFLWGRHVARICLFPCAFLLFMIPIGGLVQGTVTLQLLVSSVCNALAGWIGVKIEASGTTIRSLDGSFNFEIAEGCSGIRSLMAMITLTALYVHFTQREIWKKVVVFGGSIVFAVIGNIGRIFTVILVARFISPKLAGGLYHDYSGFIFFPIAVAAMVSFGNLVNLNFGRLFASAAKPPADQKGAGKSNPSISYDY
ncbi:MAG: exosortase/archaeosortase family protein [Verrucomicrobiota bacterium]